MLQSNVFRALAFTVGLGSNAGAVWAADEPRSSVTVLVDLSETWLNPGSVEQNRKVLEAVAEGALAAADEFDPPTVIRYLQIGDYSLMREPLCEAIYDPKLIGSKNPQSLYVSNQKAAAKYFGSDCVQFILSRGHQPYTDISGAVDSAARLSQQQTTGRKVLIVLSDLKEETRKDQVAPDALRLDGFTAILMYRVLPEDRRNPKMLDARIRTWEQRLRDAGARTTAITDVGIAGGVVRRLVSGER
jgi:hypothetical protein